MSSAHSFQQNTDGCITRTIEPTGDRPFARVNCRAVRIVTLVTQKECQPLISGLRPRTNAAPMTRMRSRGRFQAGGSFRHSATGRIQSNLHPLFISGIGVIRGRSPLLLVAAKRGRAVTFLASPYVY
jgi:hypothetical protein